MIVSSDRGHGLVERLAKKRRDLFRQIDSLDVAWEIYTCSFVVDPSSTAVTVVEVKSLMLTAIYISDIYIDVIWVRGFSWNWDGTMISKATVFASGASNLSSIVDTLSIALGSVVSL